MKNLRPLFRIMLLSIFTVALFCCKKDDKTTPVTQPTPKASFTFTSNDLVTTFKNVSTNAASYQWDFGDSATSTDANPVHTYKHYGTYRVLLKAISRQKTDTLSQSVTTVRYETLIQIKTRFGEMIMWLYDETPKHKANFIKLADSGYFDSTTFHRVIPNFVTQGGDPNSKDNDPNNDGYGGPPYTIPMEYNAKLTHVYGAVGAASTAAKGPTSGSQFYIVNAANGTHNLDGNYTVFGQIIKGVDIAVTIAQQPVDANNRPLKDIRMDVNTLHMTRADIKAQYGYDVK